MKELMNFEESWNKVLKQSNKRLNNWFKEGLKMNVYFTIQLLPEQKKSEYSSTLKKWSYRT